MERNAELLKGALRNLKFEREKKTQKKGCIIKLRTSPRKNKQTKRGKY